MQLVIAPEPPTADDVTALIAAHLTFSRATSPACHVHALDASGLVDPAVTFVAARRDGDLVAIGALKDLGDEHGELKSMHTRADERGAGTGSAMVGYLLGLAGDRGFRRVSLETGSQDEFEPARRLYARHGFERCRPFGEYTDNPYSICMTLVL